MPESVRKKFRAYGRTGGRTRAERMNPQARSAAARKAVVRRWIRERFGAPSFRAAGLPGGEIIDAGLDALCSGRETPESLLVSLAAPRLRRERVPVPPVVFDDADRRLYDILERDNEGLAHARYLAYLRQAESFANACSRSRIG